MGCGLANLAIVLWISQKQQQRNDVMHLLIAMLIFSAVSSGAKGAESNTVDIGQFGQLSAATVKLAIGLDYFNRKCNGETTLLYLNQTNFVLNQIGGRSSNSVLESAANVMGTTPQKLRQFAVNEAEGVANQYGGCTSRDFQSVRYRLIDQFGGYQRHLLEVADLMKRNPGRNVFR